MALHLNDVCVVVHVAGIATDLFGVSSHEKAGLVDSNCAVGFQPTDSLTREGGRVRLAVAQDMEVVVLAFVQN